MKSAHQKTLPPSSKFKSRKPKILQVVQLGLEESVLRQKAKTVKDVFDQEVQDLIDDLLATCKDFDGVGIAAPQVGESLRICIIASAPNARYPDAPRMVPTAMINPKITHRSPNKFKGWEGCLSFPGMRALVPRHFEITVEYTDRNGNFKQKTYENFIARIIQHELEHLNGGMFFYGAKKSEIVTEKEYLRLLAKEAREK